jgi:hypothetical protein
MILVVFVFVILLLLLLYLYMKRKRTGQKEEAEAEYSVCGSPLANIPYDTPSGCLVIPRNGACLFEDLELVNGCCTLIKNDNSDALELTISITSVVVAMMAVDYAIQGSVSRGSRLLLSNPAIRRVAAEIISRVTGRTVSSVIARLTASAASDAASRAAARAAARIATKAAWRAGVSAYVKVQTKLAMATVKASMGPVGWAWIALDATSIVIDVLDPQGYTTFVSNKYLKDMRDGMEFQLYDELGNVGYDWPIIFDITDMYFGEFVAAYEWAKLPFIQQAMNDTIGCKTLEEKLDINSWYDQYTQRVSQYLNREPRKRDENIFAKMVELLGDKSNNIKLYPFLSTENTVGISLSAEGVEVWNGLTDAERLGKLNESEPDTEPLTEDIFKDFRLVMTDTYRVPDNPPRCRKPHKEIVDHMIQIGKEIGSLFSGGRVDTTECVPVMNDKTFPEKVPMYVVPFSEDICLHGADGLVEATTGACGTDYQGKDFGVTWNPDTNLCNYTSSYCDRMGLDYDSNTKDCKTYPGQEEMEMFFPTGTTITRNVIRYGLAVESCDSSEYRAQQGYPDVHTCRMGEITLIGDTIENYELIGECDSDKGNYRNKDECKAARSLQAIVETMPGSFMLKLATGDCEWTKPIIEGLVDAGEAAGEFFEGDFADFFEEDVGGVFENIGNAANPGNW